MENQTPAEQTPSEIVKKSAKLTAHQKKLLKPKTRAGVEFVQGEVVTIKNTAMVVRKIIKKGVVLHVVPEDPKSKTPVEGESLPS